MKWFFTDTGLNSGSFNMDFDLRLANSPESDGAVLRLYRWEPYCISLGANQSIDSLQIEKINTDGLDVVNRPTGGRAILHSEELTYSVIYPAKKLSSVRILYKEINLALQKGLQFFDERLQGLNLEQEEPHFPSCYKNEKSAICFAVSSQNEINFNGKKLVGSAQRKMENVILQHGSILCGSYHKKIADYLLLEDSAIIKIRDELNKTTTDLNEILNTPIDIDSLSESIKAGFENHFGITFQNYKHHPEFVLSNG
ncbi:MAG: hypothetical protein PVF17_02025 [Ignavibacteria bacterium]